MLRDSDVHLELGFHCVVNKSQKDIAEGTSQDELWKKEKLFSLDFFLRFSRCYGVLQSLFPSWLVLSYIPTF